MLELETSAASAKALLDCNDQTHYCMPGMKQRQCSQKQLKINQDGDK
jgi:hypothetical protein